MICTSHVWGDGPDDDHRACVKCGKVVKLEWKEPYRAPPLNPDDVEVVNNGGRLVHIPTGIGVSCGEGPGASGFYQLPKDWWNELAIRVEAHEKAKAK